MTSAMRWMGTRWTKGRTACLAGCLLVAALCLLADASWRYAKFLLMLLPSVLLFVKHPVWTLEGDTNIPAFRRMNRSVGSCLLLSMVGSFLLFGIAILFDRELGWSKWLVGTVCSAYLMTLGITAFHLTKRRLAGLLVPVIYCAVCLFGGPWLAESMWFFSVSVGSDIYFMTLWDNLVYLTALTIVLYSCNVMYVGRTENAGRFVLCGMILGVVVVMLINLPSVSGIDSSPYQTVSDGGHTLQYDSEIPEEKAQDLLRQWTYIEEMYQPFLGESVRQTEAMCMRAADAPESGLCFSYRYLKDLNPPRFAGEDNSLHIISSALLDSCGLDTLPPDVREGWYGYLEHAVLPQQLSQLYSQQELLWYLPEAYLPSGMDAYLDRITKRATPADEAACLLYELHTRRGADGVREVLTRVAAGDTPQSAMAAVEFTTAAFFIGPVSDEKA